MQRRFQLSIFLSLTGLFLSLSSCVTSVSFDIQPVDVPFLKNSANECYYLDEFMPTPDGMVPGRFGKLNLRYYTYKTANYKDWKEKEIVLSFYSDDENCWSLFEEYLVSSTF